LFLIWLIKGNNGKNILVDAIIGDLIKEMYPMLAHAQVAQASARAEIKINLRIMVPVM
jgi:hypothetical protein